jgi:hypothetical protein
LGEREGDLRFLDGMGVQLGSMRTHARGLSGETVYDVEPVYRGSKVSIIGTMSIPKVLVVMTIEVSVDDDVFEVYFSQCLVPMLGMGEEIVGMVYLPARKGDNIELLIVSVGAMVLD